MSTSVAATTRVTEERDCGNRDVMAWRPPDRTVRAISPREERHRIRRNTNRPMSGGQALSLGGGASQRYEDTYARIMPVPYPMFPLPNPEGPDSRADSIPFGPSTRYFPTDPQQQSCIAHLPRSSGRRIPVRSSSQFARRRDRPGSSRNQVPYCGTTSHATYCRRPSRPSRSSPAPAATRHSRWCRWSSSAAQRCRGSHPPSTTSSAVRTKGSTV